MKNLILLVVILLVHISSIAQPCLPEGIIFTTQSQIDSFQINYPNCTDIAGYISIGSTEGTDISNLEGLNNITSVGNGLGIYNNYLLTNLSGLGNLTSIEGSFTIGGIPGSGNDSLVNFTGLENLISVEEFFDINFNHALTSLTGLENLISVGALHFWGNSKLQNLEGLDNLTTVVGRLSIGENFALSSLSNLNNLTTIGGDLEIYGNTSLISLSALGNLLSIGGHIWIADNESLTSFIGLDNIEASTIEELQITDNYSLSECEVLSVCNYLANPIGIIEIHDNAPGCNSIEEVQTACDAVSVEELSLEDSFTISPNPCSGKFSLSFSVFENRSVSIELHDISGKKLKNLFNDVLEPGSHYMEFDVAGLREGIYFCTIITNEIVQTKKLIIQ